MKYYKNLYMTDALKKKKDKMIKKMEAGKFMPGIHLITLAANPKNHLEIWHYPILLQPAFPKEGLFVVGITKGYEEALEVVEEIVQEVYNKTEGTDIRSYILSKAQEG